MDISRPPQSAQINCPACGHATNMHARNPADRATTCCPCIWTPNDIAWYLVFGGLTPSPTPKPRPMGAWE